MIRREHPGTDRFLLLTVFCYFLCANEVVSGNAVVETSIPICSLEAIDSPSHQPSKHVATLPVLGQTSLLSLVAHGNVSAVAQGHEVQCILQLETCVNCLINVQYAPPRGFLADLESKLISKCDGNVATQEACFNLEFLEPKSDHSGVRRLLDYYSRMSIWDSPGRSSVNSTTSAITLRVFLKNVNLKAKLVNYLDALFPIRVTVYENVELLEGSSTNESSNGLIESPRFPDAYPRNIQKNFTIVNRDPQGYVRLVFDDFHVHFQSELRILDSDFKELFNSRADYRRPPALMSTGNRLFVIFASHDFSQLIGFRARYEFVDEKQWLDQPSAIDCDKHFENHGGLISISNFDELIHTHIDCVFLIGKIPLSSSTFDHIYLKVEEYHVQGVELKLEVREGAVSTSERILFLVDAQSRSQLAMKQPSSGFSTRDHVMPAYYVRLRGYLTSTAGLSIVYTQYYRWHTALCPGNGEFHCDNARCIKTTLRCDTVNHCGDDSDEVCAVSDDVYDHSSENEIAGIITVVIGACLLLLLILLLLAILTRIYRNKLVFRLRREVSHMQRSPPAEAEVTTGPSMQTVGDRRFYVLPENQISVIEAPPTYDDALKHPSVLSGYPTPAYANPSFAQTPTEDAPSSSQAQNDLPAYSSRTPSPRAAPQTSRRNRNAQQKALAPPESSTSPQRSPTQASEATDATKDSESWV